MAPHPGPAPLGCLPPLPLPPLGEVRLPRGRQILATVAAAGIGIGIGIGIGVVCIGFRIGIGIPAAAPATATLPRPSRHRVQMCGYMHIR